MLQNALDELTEKQNQAQFLTEELEILKQEKLTKDNEQAQTLK